MWVVLLGLVLLQDKEKPKPSAEDKKPFVSDACLCTIKKPQGKEADWTFTTDHLPGDGVVRLSNKIVMGFFSLIRCQKPLPKQKLVVDDASAKRYEDGILASKNIKNQKTIKSTKGQFPTGDECRILEFEFEPLKSPDTHMLQVWMFASKANGYVYTIEVYVPKSQYKFCKAQIESILSGFSAKAPGKP
jgi:hypothetical protein